MRDFEQRLFEHDGPRPGLLVPLARGEEAGVRTGAAHVAHSRPGVIPASASSQRLWIAGVLLVALVGLMLFARLGALPLVNPDEGRNAQIASEMQRSGSWLIPTYNGATYLDKPAFFFRAVALSLGALGESEAAARLPSAIAALILAGVVFAFVRSRYGLRTGALVVAVLVTTPLYVAFARIVIFDMLLTLFVVSAIVCGFLAEEHEGLRRTRWYLSCAAAMGFATLVKGPVGFILPLVVLTVFHLVEKRPSALRRLFSWRNGIVFFVLVLPWFLGVAKLHPEFPRYGIVEESLRRFGTTAMHRSQPFWFFLPVIVAGCLPWSVLFPAGAIVAWKARRHWTRTDRFLLVWVVTVVVFFSLSQSKLPGYILPAVVALAILVARAFDVAMKRPLGRSATWIWRSTVAAAFAILLVAGVFALEAFRPGFLAAIVRWKHLENVTEKVQWSLVACAFAAGGVGLATAAWKRRTDIAFVTTALFLPLVCAIGFRAVRRAFDDLSTRHIAHTLSALHPGVDVACLQSYPDGLGFYLQRTFPLFTDDGSELKSNYVRYVYAQPGEKPANMLPLAAVDAWLDARTTPVVLVGDKHQRDWLVELARARGSEPMFLDGFWSGALIQPAGAR
jgi:4-amino-4-deoxy-L-arabinose transferase-like glycosyltransferase